MDDVFDGRVNKIFILYVLVVASLELVIDETGCT